MSRVLLHPKPLSPYTLVICTIAPTASHRVHRQWFLVPHRLGVRAAGTPKAATCANLSVVPHRLAVRILVCSSRKWPPHDSSRVSASRASKLVELQEVGDHGWPVRAPCSGRRRNRGTFTFCQELGPEVAEICPMARPRNSPSSGPCPRLSQVILPTSRWGGNSFAVFFPLDGEQLF